MSIGDDTLDPANKEQNKLDRALVLWKEQQQMCKDLAVDLKIAMDALDKLTEFAAKVAIYQKRNNEIAEEAKRLVGTGFSPTS